MEDYNIITDSFYNDKFYVHDHAHFDGVALPLHVEFTHLVTHIANAPTLPFTIRAQDLVLDKPQDADTFLLEASCIDSILCEKLTLVNPGTFPRYIYAKTVVIEQTEDALDEKPPTIDCRITLTPRHPMLHKDLLLTLAQIPETNRADLHLTVGHRPLHLWGFTGRCTRFWSELAKTERSQIIMLLDWYKSIHEKRERFLEHLKPPLLVDITNETTGRELG